MLKICILRNYSYPDLLRQTPGSEGRWGDCAFSIDEPGQCNYAIVLCGLKEPAIVECSPDNVWALIQEPPVGFRKEMHKGQIVYRRIFNQLPGLNGDRYVLSQPALPWHVNKTYDQLKTRGVPDKSRNISWITSNLTSLPGHQTRMKFLQEIKGQVNFDLFGRGFNFINDKWDGVGPYHYSIAFENCINPYYWSEKISDCFLAWSMPIYYGNPRITDYFPKEAMIQIDINDPNVAEIIRDVATVDHWKKHIDAIEYARNLVLEKYQLFPFLANQVSSWESIQGSEKKVRQIISIPVFKVPRKSFGERIYAFLSRRLNQLLNTQSVPSNLG